MPTPAIEDEVLVERIAVYRANDNHQGKTAAALGIARSTLQWTLRLAAERGLMGTEPVLPGFVLKSVASQLDGAWVKQVKAPGAEFAIPAGHTVKGVSALVDGEGRTIQQWVKTREELSAIDVAETLKTAFEDWEPAAAVAPPPHQFEKDLLTLVVCNDWHVGMFSWRRETGVDWDLKIAENAIGQGIEDAINRSPPAGTAIILGGGDLTHADNNSNQTARSSNQLDVDGRHQKIVETAGRLMVRTIDAALRRNDQVIVRNLKGNHDEETAAAIAWFLFAWYRNEPRVRVDLDQSLFFWHRFGKVLLGATHGHTVKLKDMAGIMAHRRAPDWGATLYRYVHGFHIHHTSKFASEGDGVIMESHQAPIPQDAWHFGSGFLSGRSLQAITYHQHYGEVSRVRVAMLDAANDNESIAA